MTSTLWCRKAADGEKIEEKCNFLEFLQKELGTAALYNIYHVMNILGCMLADYMNTFEWSSMEKHLLAEANRPMLTKS